VHCFFESYHASGVQDSVGKDARLAMIRSIGFKLISIYDYRECMVSLSHVDVARVSITDDYISHVYIFVRSLQVWSQKNMEAPKGGQTRIGDFSATGEYKWYAFAEQPGPVQEEFKYEVLDLRKKVRRFYIFHFPIYSS